MSTESSERPALDALAAGRRWHLAVLALLALLIGGAARRLRQQQQTGVLLAGQQSRERGQVSSTVPDVKKNGVGTLKSAVLQIQQNATAAVNQAKSDFEPDHGTEDLG